MVADGFCDDDTNNLACNFDGGDCCGFEVLEDYCDDCNCHEDWYEGEGQKLLLVFKAKLIRGHRELLDDRLRGQIVTI